MKKFYAFIVAVLVAAVSFAQGGKALLQRPQPTVVGHVQTLFAKSAQRKAVKGAQRKAAKSVIRRAADGESSYVKVSSTPSDWEGWYLIVYEDGGVAMNGGLTDKLDAISNTIDITVSGGAIESTSATDAAAFHITKSGSAYSIQGAGGLYMGRSSNSNGLESSSTKAYENTLSIASDGSANIVSDGGAYLRFNASSGQDRFRYYKSSSYTNQQAIALYKLDGEWTQPDTPSAGDYELVELPDGLETEDYALVVNGYVSGDSGWESETINQTVQVAFDGTDVYIQGLSYWVPDAYVKGTLQGSQVLVPCTYMGTDDYGYENYVIPYVYDATGEDVEDADYFVLDYDEESGAFTLNEEYIYAESDDPTAAEGWYDYWYELTLTPGEAVQPEVVEVPEGLEVEQYNLVGTSLTYEEDEEDENADPTPVYTSVSGITHVGFDGTDVYIQGLNAYLTDAWVKGTVSGNTITLPAGQYYGKYETWFGEYDMYFAGTNEDGTELQDVVLTISEDGKTLTAQNWVLTNSTENSVAPYELLTEMVLTKAVDKAATPAAPSVVDYMDYDEEYGYGMVVLEVPAVDVDGDPMIVDNLYYVVYVDEAGDINPYVFEASLYEALDDDLVEVPFTLDDDYDFDVDGEQIWLSLNSETSTYDRIGVQSIYRGGGEEHKSDIVWFTIERGDDAVRSVAAARKSDGAIYTLSGQRVTKALKGVYIQDGKKFVVK